MKTGKEFRKDEARLSSSACSVDLRPLTNARLLADYLHALADYAEEGRDVVFPLSNDQLKTTTEEAYDELLRMKYPLIPFKPNSQDQA